MHFLRTGHHFGSFFWGTNLRPILLLIVAISITPINSHAQAGCTDMQANNYDAAATVNNGSCTYPITTYFAPVKTTLADTLREISGMVLANGKWWTHNDSGNDHTFFQFDPETGSVQKYIKLKQAENKDWEDITTDGQNIYIGDFGNNNNGDRTDLGIYKVPFSAIGNSTVQSVDNNEYSFLPFVYEDQTDFSNQPEDSIEYDCEAFIYYQGNIHLFSKNWKTLHSTHYSLNQTTEIAEKRATFDVQGLITSASISPDGKLIALLGYNKSGTPNVFLWLLWDWQGDDFFSGNKRRLELGSPISYGKSEAIAFKTDRGGYIGNEFLNLSGITLATQATRTFDFSAFAPVMVGTHENTQAAANDWIKAYPNPFSESIHFDLVTGEQPDHIRIINAIGMVVFESDQVPTELSTLNWAKGVYFIEAIFKEGKSMVQWVMENR